MSREQQIEKVSIVFGLLIECPLDKPMDTCPALELRDLPIGEKFDIVNGFSEEQLDDIITHHNKCLRERESDFFKLAD
jgi:hypothetical protein